MAHIYTRCIDIFVPNYRDFELLAMEKLAKKVKSSKHCNSFLSHCIRNDGIEALTCWDSASQLNCISPDFIWAIGLKLQTKAEPVKIRLRLKGSSSRCSYEVTLTIELGEKKIEDFTLSVVNIYKWDVILGNGFLNRYENKRGGRSRQRKKKATLAVMSK